MQLPRASTSALADGYCTAIVAESLVVVFADVAVTCCAVVGRAGNPAARTSEMPIAAKRGRAWPIASPPPFGSYRLRLPSEVNPASLMTSPRGKSHHTGKFPPQHVRPTQKKTVEMSAAGHQRTCRL